jgi:2-polyprenyl-3-methyl-5-hydroxy-6-metoxy-1,4-benzoquinol methylase
MNRLEFIRAEEKKYHDYCYDNYNLFEPGSWLHKPVRTVMELMNQFANRDSMRVLDLGCGIGRNSIPVAQSLLNRNGAVVCVDLLKSAIDKLQENSEKYGVHHLIKPVLSDIEQFNIGEAEYDLIIAVSTLEHISSEQKLVEKLQEMAHGTKENGMNCIIISTNIREVDLKTNAYIDPLFEVNLSTVQMLELLDSQYKGWEIQRRLVKPLEYDIVRNEQPVILSSDCITYVAKKRGQ